MLCIVMLEVERGERREERGHNKEYKVKAGKKLGSGETRNQILLLRCQLELGQKHILNDIDYRDKIS